MGLSLTCYKRYLDIGTMPVESVPHPLNLIPFRKWHYRVLRSAVGKTHDLRSDLWWTIPLDISLDHFGIPFWFQPIRLYSEIDQIHLSSEAQCVSHHLPQVDCHTEWKQTSPCKVAHTYWGQFKSRSSNIYSLHKVCHHVNDIYAIYLGTTVKTNYTFSSYWFTIVRI